MKHTATRALYAYWNRLRAGRAAPERSDVDPGAIRTLLGDVFLLELDERGRHMVRLAGTRICAIMGREWRGRPFADPFAPEDHPALDEFLHGVSASATPAVASVTGETADGRALPLELLALPLRYRGRPHARLLGCLVAAEWPYWAGVVPMARLRLTSERYLRPAEEEGFPGLSGPPGIPLGRLRLLPGGRP